MRTGTGCRDEVTGNLIATPVGVGCSGPATFPPRGATGSSRPGLPSGLHGTILLPMTFTPWQFIVVAIAGWMNRQQQQVIEYLREENRILREKLGHKRLSRDGIIRVDCGFPAPPFTGTLPSCAAVTSWPRRWPLHVITILARAFLRAFWCCKTHLALRPLAVTVFSCASCATAKKPDLR